MLVNGEGAFAGGLMEEQAVQGDGGIVGPEDLDGQVIHQVLHALVQICGVEGVEQLILWLLSCRQA